MRAQSGQAEAGLLPRLRGPILVTGGTGFVGSHLVDYLTGQGVPVRCLARRKSGLEGRALVEVAYGDLATGAGLDQAVRGIRTVFHVAGVTKAFSARDYHLGNVTGTLNLLKALRNRPGPLERFVHVSSLAAIGPSEDGRPVKEDAEPRPLTHYGKSKLEGERALLASEFAARAVMIRPAVVYGPRDTDVLQVFRAAARGLLLRIGSAEQFVSIIFVRDLVRMLIRAAACESARGQTYFAAAEDPVSWSEFAGAAAAFMGRSLRPVPVPPAAAYAIAFLAELGARCSGKPGILSRQKILEAQCRYWTCGTERARADLGFVAGTTLQEGIAETLAWYKSAGWLKF